MLNQELMKKWIAALRSGQYSQCRGILHRKAGSFCALGVLEDVAHSGASWRECGPGYVSEDSSLTMPSSSTTQLIGHACGNLEVNPDYPVWQANDDGWTFKAIADALEANYITHDEVQHERETSEEAAPHHQGEQSSHDESRISTEV